MAKCIEPDLVGQVYGCWTVLNWSDKKNYLVCECKCGLKEPVYSPDIIRGRSTSCMNCAFKLRTRSLGIVPIKRGEAYGCWTVVEAGEGNSSLCECKCGIRKSVLNCRLRKSRNVRCKNCNSKATTNEEKMRARWMSMKTRCYCKSAASYKNYGARGIAVCERWKNSFEEFARDVGHPPSEMHSLDRIDNDGDYSPDNVRWTTAKQQANNRRNTKMLSYNGESLPISEWARRLGVDGRVIHLRLNDGWSIEDAVTKPVRRSKRSSPIAVQIDSMGE